MISETNSSRHPFSLLKSIEEHAARTPNAEAIRAPGHSSLTYARLIDRITQLAQALRRLNPDGEVTTAVALPDGPDLAVMFLAAMAAGRCSILNPFCKTYEFHFYFSDLKPNVLVLQTETDCVAGTVAKEHGIKVIEIALLPSQEAGIFDAGILEEHSHTFLNHPEGNVVALEAYTSGTTDRPKRVPLTHAMIGQTVNNINNALRLSSDDSCLNVMPMHHAHGLLIATGVSLFSGGSVICSPGFDPDRFFHWMQSEQPTWYTAAPAIHQNVLQVARRDQIEDLRLRFIRSSASALPARVLERMEDLFRVPVLEGYGMTECPLIANNPFSLRKRGSVGIVTGPDLAVLDENGERLETGQTGEIAIRGSCVTSGYENDWLKTGDAGFFDSDGYLFLTGRLKDVINRGGEKISPAEVDAILLQHPQITEAACFGIPHETLGEDVAAAVVLNENSAVTERDIRDFTFNHLVEYKVPRRIFSIERLPRNPAGKILRRELLDACNVSKSQPAKDSRVLSEIEEKLLSLWEEILGIHPIHPNDDFLQLGGDSISATRIISRIRKLFQVELPLRSILDSPTIAELAQRIQLELQGGRQNLYEISHPDSAPAVHVINRPVPWKPPHTETSPIDFSLFFFSADGSQTGMDKYRLLLESAKFADANGFSAVWIPERHFHAFGGLYPNPAVLGAALATITQRIQIRAGSVVLPLQNPLRIAEEWSVLDNLTGGRVAISCASGWHANDFVLSPDNYQDRRKVMWERIEILRRLWRGERIQMPNGAGNSVEVGIFPRPVQPELPFWISCHSDESFRKAGEHNFNIITNLHSTTLEKVAEQIALYKRTLQEHGHDPEKRKITLMLHTFIGETKEAILKEIRSAYSDYFNSFLSLHKNQAFEGEFELTESDRTFLLSRAIDRFYEVRDLVGTLETCSQRVQQIQTTGVNEIACLIDFGINTDSVFAGLRRLQQLKLSFTDKKVSQT